MFYFIEKLRSYLPDFIITQPTFGYPQVDTRTIRIGNEELFRFRQTTSSSTTVGMWTGTAKMWQILSASWSMRVLG